MKPVSLCLMELRNPWKRLASLAWRPLVFKCPLMVLKTDLEDFLNRPWRYPCNSSPCLDHK